MTAGVPQMEITLDYPVRPSSRWGHGRPPNRHLQRILNGGRERYRRHLKEIVSLAPRLRSIEVDPSEEKPLEPAWSNPWFSGLDLAALYMFIARYRPARYVEVGSGWTTKVARRAALDAGLRLHITSIDPEPRAGIDEVCDLVVRQAAEDVPPDMLADLAAGDILFIDSSHRVFMNSDCVVFFLEVFPELKSDVLVQIHDIFLPYDYPPEWTERYYSEQYMLATWLIAGGSRFLVELPNMFVSVDPDLSGELLDLWSGGLAGVQRQGGSFWLRTQG